MILQSHKVVVESVCCDEIRAVACHFKVGQPERSGWADTLLGTSRRLVASGWIKGTSVRVFYLPAVSFLEVMLWLQMNVV